MAEFASKGVAGAGLGTGIAGLSLGVLNGLGGILGLGNNCLNAQYAQCSENMNVNRYELSQESRISKLESDIALRDANTYNDQKMLEMYKYIDGEIKRIDRTLCEQAVYNATQTGAITSIQAQVAQLQALTKTVIPIDNVCPEPMKRYNSWTAPTTTPTTTG